MRIKYISIALGVMLRYISLMILTPCIIAIIYKEYSAIMPFICAASFSLILGFLLKRHGENEDTLNDIKKSEALFTVAVGWVLYALIAAIPYLFFKLSPLDALFEATSGITTTGATILQDFSLYPHAMFFWRSMSQWLGGMGIIVLFVAVLPQFRVAGRQMFFAEAPTPTEEKVTPRIRHTATGLWAVYLLLTILQIILMIAFGMPVFDAVCNSLSTLAAGGFSPNPQSIMGYNSTPIVWITLVFMFLAGINFALQYKVFVKKTLSPLFKSEEFRLYIVLVIGLSILLGGTLYFEHQYSLISSIKNALFQVVSIMTTTGFASVDFEKWHVMAKIFLFVAMFTGASAGSAAGGVKLVRILYVFKYLKVELLKILHPNAVIPIKIDKNIVPEDVGRQIFSFVAFYFLIFAISVFLVALIEKNAVIAVTGSISAIGNIGPSFNALGPMGNFATLQDPTKIIFIITMLIGRLEIIPFLAILHPDLWKIK